MGQAKSTTAGQRGFISMMTDFGLTDGFVGAMKGVIYDIAPHVRLIDISHKIKPQHLLQASLILKNAYPYCPSGTVHLAVVDPGVGTERKAILVTAGDHWFVGPDNGLFTFLFANDNSWQAWELTNPKYFLPEVSNTFHGRDVFAPAAAHLAAGVPPEELGRPLESPERIHYIEPDVSEKRIVGKVIHIDNFGNLITNISTVFRDRLIGSPNAIIKVKNKPIRGLSTAYDQAKRNSLLAIYGSWGLMEISVNFGNAQRFLQAEIGDNVAIVFK